MITPDDVRNQLLANLPRHTSMLASIEEGDAIATATSVLINRPGHKMASGTIITVADVQVRIPVTSQVFDSVLKRTTITLEFDHDRTSGDTAGEFNAATFDGFGDLSFNADFDIISAERDTLVIYTPLEMVAGDLGYLVERRGLEEGLAVVVRVDDDFFQIELQDTAIPVDAVFEVFKFTACQCIKVASDLKKAADDFAKHANMPNTLYIVFGQEVASKDRHTANDSIISANSQNPIMVTYIRKFSIYYMTKVKDDQLCACASQRMYETLQPALRKSLFGYEFSYPGAQIVFAAIEESNVSVPWNSGFYVHEFQYNVPYRIDLNQGYTARDSVSLRNITVDAKMFDTDGALVSLNAEIEI